MSIICIDSQPTRAKEVFWKKKRSLSEDKDLGIYYVEEGQGFADRTKVGYSARGN